MNPPQLIFRFPYQSSNGREYCWILYTNRVEWKIKENEKWVLFSKRNGDLPIIKLEPEVTPEQVSNHLSESNGYWPIYYIENFNVKDTSILDQMLYIAHASTVSCISRTEIFLKWAVKTDYNINRLYFDKPIGLIAAISLGAITKMSLDGKVREIIR